MPISQYFASVTKCWKVQAFGGDDDCAGGGSEQRFPTGTREPTKAIRRGGCVDHIEQA